MKNFTKLFTLLLMAAMSMGVMAETAILNWKMGENGADAPSDANSITGAAGCAAVGFTISMPDGGDKAFGGGDWINHDGTNYKTIKNSKGQRIKVELPSGYEAQAVKIYLYTKDQNAATLSEFNGEVVSEAIAAGSTKDAPAIITKTLENETSFTFTISGEQIYFIAVITYRAQPTGDSYTFGYEATLAGTNLSALAAHEDGCAHVTVSALSTTYATNSNRSVKQGSSDVITAATTYRNLLGSNTGVSIQSQNGETDGAETLGTYVAYKLNMDLGYKISLTGINANIYSDRDKTSYEILIEDKEGAEVYRSAVQYINKVAEPNEHFVLSVTDLIKSENVRDLTGEVTVKMIFWIVSSSANLAIKDFKVTGLVSELPGEGSKSLSFLEDFEDANPKVFADAEPANVTATWVRATNKVKNNTTKGIQFRGGDDSQKLTIAVDEDSYIESIVFTCDDGTASDGKYMDASVKNASGNEVDTYATTEKKKDVTWNCGYIRESELTFDQKGAGNVYIKSVTVTYRLKPATITYTRNHVHMNLNTLCFPYQIDSYTGATFYTMLYKVVDGSVVTEVVLQEHVGALEAGKPYFYVPEGTKLVCECSGDYTSAGNDGNGVYGSYTNLAPVTSGMYVTYNDQIVKAGSNVKLGEYRAYINMSEVEVESGAMLVPGRKLLRIGNASNAPQGVDETQTDKVQSIKVIRNGQVVIIRDNKMYNVLGQEL